MHVFFEPHWKLHIGEIPEKPKIERYSRKEHLLHDLNKYCAAIAAIKQNALTVWNSQIIPRVGNDGFEIFKLDGNFHKWPGGAEYKLKPNGKEMVAILTLPEEKKNTMENRTIEEKADEYIKQYLPHVNTTGHWLGFQDGYKQALAERSGSVAAPKEERTCPKCGSGKVIMFTSDDYLCQTCGATFPGVLNGPSELASLRQQLEQKTLALDSYYKLAAEVAPLKEALKELIGVAKNYLDLDKMANPKSIEAIIEKARKLISK